VSELVDQVVALVDPDELWLFGSVVRGDDDGDSDIDLLVVLPSFDPPSTMDPERRVHGSITTPAPFDVAFTTPAASCSVHGSREPGNGPLSERVGAYMSET
jgi:hypothetical protein